ncbi:GntR family transcriptional regulator [bacterium]|nr:GntR family transcriptional regulator [bacterium]
MDLGKISKENLTSRVYQQIKEAIMSGHFQPGERLSIRSLAKTMGTSITPVREALLKLVSYGALEMMPAQSITIPVMNKEKYLENRTIRIANEGLAAAEAAKKIKKRQLNHLIKINNEMIQAAKKNYSSESIAKNYQFHLELCKAAEMPTLLEIVEILWLKIGPSLNLLLASVPESAPKTKSNFHQQILEALEKRDSESARKAIEQDLIQGGAYLLAHFEQKSP